MSQFETDGGEVESSADRQAHPFDVARNAVHGVNGMLADTDGTICVMSFDGAVGYHHYVASGETDPEFLWKVALLQALDETVFEMIHVDGPTASDARSQIERELEEYFDPFTAENVADRFEEKLENLIEVQEDSDRDGDSA